MAVNIDCFMLIKLLYHYCILKHIHVQPLHFCVDIQITVMEWALYEPRYLNLYCFVY